MGLENLRDKEEKYVGITNCICSIYTPPFLLKQAQGGLQEPNQHERQ